MALTSRDYETMAEDFRGELAWDPEAGWLCWTGDTWSGPRARIEGRPVNLPALRVNQWMEEHGYRPLTLNALQRVLRYLQGALVVTTDGS